MVDELLFFVYRSTAELFEKLYYSCSLMGIRAIVAFILGTLL